MTLPDLFQRHPRPWRVEWDGPYGDIIEDANGCHIPHTGEVVRMMVEIINALPEPGGSDGE